MGRRRRSTPSRSWPVLLNVGQGEDHSVREYYETVLEVVGYDGALRFDASKPSGVRRRLLDSSVARSLGWSPRTSLRDGIEANLPIVPPPPRRSLTWTRRTVRSPLATSTWDEAEYTAIRAVVDRGRFTMGPLVAQFERDFAATFGADPRRHGQLGSSANLLAIAAAVLDPRIDLNPGDEVLVPAVSWATTYYPLHQYGLR